MASRIEERDRLMVAIGMIAQPLQRLVDEGLPSDPTAVSYIRAQHDADCLKFNKDLEAFCRIGDVWMSEEFVRVRTHVYSLRSVIEVLKSAPDQATSVWSEKMTATLGHLRDIPCLDPGVVLPSASPFQTYLQLRARFASAVVRAELLDPYLAADAFHRYLADVSPTAALTILTSDKVMLVGPGASADKLRRRDHIVAVSTLLAHERGPRYRFLVTPSLHDRHCRIDDQILHLGGSVNAAGKNDPYTISNLDPTTSNQASLDTMIAGAEEWFGPGTKVHRTS